MIFKKTVFIIILISFILINFIFSIKVNAEDKVILLAPDAIGFSEGASIGSFIVYARGAYNTLLIIAVILASLMITIGGVYYLFSYLPGMKEEGKKTINAAVLGLLIALLSWLILNTINPELIKFKGDIFNTKEVEELDSWDETYDELLESIPGIEDWEKEPII